MIELERLLSVVCVLYTSTLSNWTIVKTWSTMFWPWSKHGQGTCFDHVSNINVKWPPLSEHGQMTMVWPCSKHVFWPWSKHVLTMFWPWSRIDYGRPRFDHGGHLTLMVRTWSTMVRSSIDYGLTMFQTWSEHGQNMVRTWSEHGQNVVRTWSKHG